jgi:hypothetical protein
MPAPWVTPEQVQAVCPAAWDGTQLAGPIEAASSILFALSGGVWPGPQADVVRPCTPLQSLGYTGGSSYGPVYATGAWAPLGGWCGCSGPDVCGCATASHVQLPGVPATSVQAVTVDAVVLPATAYRLTDQLLVRTDGGSWPCCQDLAVAGDQPGAWQVAYTWGAEPPLAGQYACAALACELWKATTGSAEPGIVDSCRLPKRITSITRQGVSMALLDPMTMFPEGLTGLPEVDLWLGSLRYGQAHRPAVVLVPGQRQRALRDA